jgi:signal transduction histidine kinase
MSPAERTQSLERLLEVTRLGASLELEPFLRTLLSAARELTASETVSILELDETSGQFRFAAALGSQREALHGMKVPLEGSAAGQVFQERRPLRISNLTTDSRQFSALDFASASETRTLLGVPLMAGGQALGVVEAVNKAGNVHYTEEDITILETLAGLAALAIHNDRLRRRIDASYSELAELDRLKNDFIAITSHELRTPLGLILGHATFLRELLNQENREQLDIIIKNASKLKEIIESLSNVDNFQSGAARLRQRPVSVARIVQDVAASFADTAAGRNITLRSDLPADDLLVEADGGKLAIALSNLVKNALTFTDNGGHILISGQPVPGYIKVSVIDDGIGIPTRDLPRVFERFFQVESHLTRRHGGMGLGLAVAKVMVELHGGRIWVESAEGQGSNFTFLLPVSPPEVDADSGALQP